MSSSETCALCGQSIDGEPVQESIGGGTLSFCSDGCARAYREAHAQTPSGQPVLATAAGGPGGDLPKLFLNTNETAYFSMKGMYCAGCAAAAEGILRREDGVKQVDISFAGERGRIEYDPRQTDVETTLRKLDRLGYEARVLSNRQEQKAEKQQERMFLQLLTAAAFGMQVMLIYLVQLYPLYASGQFDSQIVRNLQYVVWILATPVLFIGGWSILQGAWRATLAGTATMDTLVAAGTLAAYTYSLYITLVGGGEVYFDSVAMIVTFIMLGRYLEKIGGSQARKDIRHLLQLQPNKARRKSQDGWEEIESILLAPGDIIMIRPGERVPADARVNEGEAALDESLLTGESDPVTKRPGSEIYAGSIVSDDTLVAEVVRPIEDTRLAQITDIVEHTLNTKPPIQRLADRASAYFAFGILAVAVVTFFGWMLIGTPVPQALLAAVAVLVVACPCALGLATPLAVALALGRTSQSGVLVRNPVALEMASTVHRIIFDKTGTLTQGKLSVVETVTVPDSEITEQDILCLAAAVEQYSEHPLAKAIVNVCSATPKQAEQFKVARGQGASAFVQGDPTQQVLVGSSDFVALSQEHPLQRQATAHARQGETVVWVKVDDRIEGFIALRDKSDTKARETLRQLSDDGILTSLWSGDNPQTTQAIAEELGLTDYVGGASPEDKARQIQEWQDEGNRVAMVGDGVNDAPALAKADLSITVAGGTDVAGETSDVVLMQRELTMIPWFIGLSRRTRRIIIENLGWAFAYNLVSVPLAAFGLISPIIAAAAMATSSLLVVGNSLRLRR